jgi:predicted N-acetyltransferase YhbS
METMVTGTLVREAAEADVEGITSVLLAANHEFEALVTGSFYRAYLADVLDIHSRFDVTQLLVAEHGGRIVGTITLYPDASHEGWGWPSTWTGIRAVAVAPLARGLGIGRQLAVECVDRSRALGADAVCLHTAPFMAAAMAMYESVGFRRAPEFDRDAGSLFGLDSLEPPIPALAYQLDLKHRVRRHR